VDFVALTLENAARPPLGKDKNQLLDNACLEFYLIFCNSSNRPRVCKTPTRTVAMISEDFIARIAHEALIQDEHRGQGTLLPESRGDHVSDTKQATLNKRTVITSRVHIEDHSFVVGP